MGCSPSRKVLNTTAWSAHSTFLSQGVRFYSPCEAAARARLRSRSPRARDEQSDRRERSEEAGEDASEASVWCYTKKEGRVSYSASHHRPRSGNSIRLHPVTARLHVSSYQFFLTFLNRTVSPSLTFVL